MSIDPWKLRQAMAQFATGVTVVTTVEGGRPYGLTASSFASLSMDPPLVLVCLSKRLETHATIEKSGVFAINILSASQREFGMRFAGMLPDVEDRFAGIDWTTGATGSPLLAGCLSWVDCRVWKIHDGGDHSIFVGEAQDVGVSEGGEAPLLYHNRLWGRGLFEE